MRKSKTFGKYIMLYFGVLIMTGTLNSHSSETQTTAAKTIKSIEFPELKDALSLKDKNLIILDARAPVFFESGNIPTSKNLPIEYFNKYWEKMKKEIVNKNTVITYCSDFYCDDSKRLAELLQSHGIKNVLVYQGGYEEWSMLDPDTAIIQ